MLEVAGEIELADTQRASVLMVSRVARPIRLASALLVVAVALSAGAAAFITHLIAPGSNGIGLSIVVALVALATVIRAQLRTKAFFDGLRDRGVSDPAASVYRLCDAGLQASGQNMDILVRWSAVSEIAAGPTFWCVIGPGAALCIPRTFFDNPPAERAFIRAILERIGESARNRSRGATDFIGAWG